MLLNDGFATTLTWHQLVIGLAMGFIPVIATLMARRITEKRHAAALADALLRGQAVILHGKPILPRETPIMGFGKPALLLAPAIGARATLPSPGHASPTTARGHSSSPAQVRTLPRLHPSEV